MAGFTLPKLRWLVLGAAAASLWAMTQEVPKRSAGAAPPQREAAAKPVTQRPAQPPEPVRAKPSTAKTEETALVVTPKSIAPPSPRPSDMITSSIPRPQKLVGPTAATQKVFTLSKVRLREKPDRSSAVVTMLSPGQAMNHLAEKGKWHLVSFGSTKGWVHGDYLSDRRPPSGNAAADEMPRPKEPVAAQTRRQPMPTDRPLTTTVQAVADTGDVPSGWGGLRPIRAPQGGDCQCPYDLMLSGKQCGDHSAYARRRGEAQCYF